MCTPKFLHRPPNPRQAVLIHLFPFFHRHKKAVPPVAVQGAKYAPRFDHLAQAGHHRSRRFLLHQLCVVDLTGGVIQNHDQVIPPPVVQPAMLASIDVQQHPRHRPPRPSADAAHACAAAWPPGRLLATLSAPRCSSTGSRARPAVSRGSAGCSGRSTFPCKARAPFLPSPAECAARLVPLRRSASPA